VAAEQSLNAPKLCTSNPVIALQSERIKPELYQLVVSLNVYMRRFITIPSVKEEPIWTDSEYGWHLCELHSIFSRELLALTSQ